MKAPALVRLFHPTKAAERLAVVTWERAGDRVMLQVARGKNRRALLDARMFGPLSEADAEVAHAEIVAGLLAEGYVAAGLGQLLLALDAKTPRARARAALRLAWRKERAAVEPLLRLTEKPKEDIATVVDALGMIGDVRALPAVRGEAEKKLLSRRRSGVEALYRLGDVESIAAAKGRARERLPEAVRAAVATGSGAAMVAALAGVSVKDRGLAADTLYELDEPGCRDAALGALLEPPGSFTQPHLWRYAKSVWKRALLRHDVETVGRLSHAFEIQSRATTGARETLKSGYDGEPRSTRVFSRATVAYLRRRAWRWLRMLARHAPEQYALAAAACLAPYQDGDDVLKGNVAATGRSYLLHRILFDCSPRYTLNARSLTFRPKPKAPPPSPGVREEAFPELWDLVPRAYVRVLGAARHTQAQRFAYEAVTRRAPNALQQASHAEVVTLLSVDDPRIVDLGLTELRRRFDPHKPDLELVLVLVGSPKDLVRNYGLAWLGECARVWTRDRAWALRLLGAGHSEARDAAARLLLAALPALGADERRALAAELLARVEQPAPMQGTLEEGALAGYAEVLRSGLAAVAAEQCTLERALALLDAADDSAVSVGAALLAVKPGALPMLGTTRVFALAQHGTAAVRRAALGMLEGALDELRAAPALLFSLLDSDWDDVRARALGWLDRVDVGALGLDGLVGLADSTRGDVQAKAQAMLINAMARDGEGAVDVHELLGRLAQHPSPAMRAFAVELALIHLKAGYVRLAKCEALFRAVLFDVRPNRLAKRRVIDFLAERGEQDENQAELAAQLLADVVRTRTKDDHDRALAALARVTLAFPSAPSGVRVLGAARPGAAP
ncbi:MAG: hypothetical protein HYS27_19680 [Deltaproteobacteria bacterium]|nr:hypothetical protein [Deltaproteobacteria bacterium]